MQIDFPTLLAFGALAALLLALLWLLRLATRRAPRFVCPECGHGYNRYYDGHDCTCGKKNLCHECHYVRHVPHDLPNCMHEYQSCVHFDFPGHERQCFKCHQWVFLCDGCDQDFKTSTTPH